MLNSPGKTVYKNLANIVSILGVLPLVILYSRDGYQYYLIPLIVYNNIMDDLDGILAGKLNIRSQFGAVLDNVCDAVAHTIFVMAVAMHWMDQGGVLGGVCAAAGLLVAMALILRVVSRLDPAAVTGTGSPTNELVRHMFFILLLSKVFGFAPAPLLITAFLFNAVSMLAPFRMPWLIRSLTKSATAIGLVNVSLVVAWLVSYAAPPVAATLVSLIAAAFLLSYLLSFAWATIWWIKGLNAGTPS
jgi:phosphatidylserine synthase